MLMMFCLKVFYLPCLKNLVTKIEKYNEVCMWYVQMVNQFFTKLRLFPSKSEKTVFAANAKYFLCMQEARENGQNFKTSGSNSTPRYQMPHHMEDLETSNSLLPGEDLKSNFRDMPGGDVEVSN
jgi:hypothetical protein